MSNQPPTIVSENNAPTAGGNGHAQATIPNLDDLITEVHKPVDSIFVEKQYRLLTEPLYTTWRRQNPKRTFLVLTNVGWFYQEKTPPLVPDCLLSMDVLCPDDLNTKAGHSYFQWQMGKSPDVVIEFVTDRYGGEETYKKKIYASQKVAHYVVFDLDGYLGEPGLRIYRLEGEEYQLSDVHYWPEIGFGIKLWRGVYEGHYDNWLRWCDEQGAVIDTGAERLQSERERAETAERRIRELEEALKRLQGP